MCGTLRVAYERAIIHTENFSALYGIVGLVFVCMIAVYHHNNHTHHTHFIHKKRIFIHF